MKTVIIEIPDDCELVYKDDKISLIKSQKIEKNRVLTELGADIQALFDKYKSRLKGKFGVKCEFSFIPYYNENGISDHWVGNNQEIKIIDGEQRWHDKF